MGSIRGQTGENHLLGVEVALMLLDNGACLGGSGDFDEDALRWRCPDERSWFCVAGLEMLSMISVYNVVGS